MIRWFIILLLALGLCACEKADPEFQKTEIESLLTQQVEAWNAGDIPGFMVPYENSENLIFTSSATIRKGFKETFERYQAAYGEKGEMGKLAFEILDTRILHGKSAVVLGSWKLTETPKAGEGLFSLVLTHGAEGWKIIHDHTSLKKQ